MVARELAPSDCTALAVMTRFFVVSNASKIISGETRRQQRTGIPVARSAACGPNLLQSAGERKHTQDKKKVPVGDELFCGGGRYYIEASTRLLQCLPDSGYRCKRCDYWLCVCVVSYRQSGRRRSRGVWRHAGPLSSAQIPPVPFE